MPCTVTALSPNKVHLAVTQAWDVDSMLGGIGSRGPRRRQRSGSVKHRGVHAKDAHVGRRIQICVDCRDAEALASFWAEALAYEVAKPPGHFTSWEEFSIAESASGERWCQVVDPDERGPSVLFHTVPEPKVTKNRLHLDVFVSTGSIDQEIDRLLALGATQVRTDPDGGFTVMTDPEGNEFYIA